MSSTVVIQCNAGDCYVDKFNGFDSSGNDVYIGDTAVAANRDVRSWFPFTVNLPRGTVIQQAYFTVTASGGSNPTVETIKIGCEAADNPSTPSTGSDLNGRSFGAYTSNVSLPQFVLDDEFTWQIDNAVQEVLQRAGWVYGNALAVMIDDVNVPDHPRRAWSYEGAPGKRAYLTLNVNSYVPRAFGML